MLTTANLSQLIAALQKDGKLPAGLTPRQTALLQKSLQKYSGEVSQRLLAKILDDFKSKLETASSMTDPAQLRGVLADLGGYVGNEDATAGIKFALKISQEVASGAGQFLNQNLSAEAVDEYPALEFKRLFSRNVPRGERIGPKGAIIEVPDEDWPTRWAAAGAAAEDSDWLPWEGDAQEGRGVALKSSAIWQALGDGEGGFDDTLGNPYPPFAFNSGFMTLDLSRREAVKLGLIGADEPAEPAKLNYEKIFSLP